MWVIPLLLPDFTTFAENSQVGKPDAGFCGFSQVVE